MECVEEVPVPPHLQTLFDKATAKWSKAKQRAISWLLNSFHDVFSRDEFDLGKMHLMEHHIETGEAAPVKVPPWHIPLAFADEDCREVEKLKRRGVIQPSTSPWAAPLVMVQKHCEVPQMCLDYCRLNAVTRDVAYPIPHTQDCLDVVAGATLFSTMDITAAYHQIPVAKEDILTTAFITKYGLYELKTMPFGLKTAPQTYQRLMELALSGLQWTACLIYLNDVIVYGKTFKEHLQRLSLVLQQFCQAGLKLKPGKCHFFETQVTFLGHLLTPDGVLPDPGNVEKIITWPVLTCVTDVRAVLGMGNYYRRFIKDYSKKMQPLIQLTKKDKSFEWTAECQKSFNWLKESLTGPDIMAYPTDHGEFILDIDKSLDMVGAVLSQFQDGVEHVIAYSSRTLSKPEQNYCVTDWELLAVRFFMEYYKHYLLGR